MRVWLLCLALIFAGCTSSATVQPTLRGPIVPTRVMPTATQTAAQTNTPLPTSTPTDTATLAFTPTFTSTPTAIPSNTPAFTATVATSTPSDTATPTQSATVPPATPSQTTVPSDTPTSTLIPSLVPTPGQVVLYRNSTALEPSILTGSVTLDTPISNSIDDAHPAVLFTYAGTAGSMIDISMTKQSGDLDAYLLVLDPKGREMARDDEFSTNNHDAGIRALPLPETGTYVIVATRYGQEFGESAGDFDLAVSATPNGETAVGTFSQATGYNSLLSGSLDSSTSEQVYTFRAVARDVVTIQMTKTSGNLDPNLVLTNNLGTTIVANDDNLLTGTLDAAIQSYIIPRNGYYAIIAGHFTGEDNSGGYRLKLARDSQNATGIDATVNTINSSTINDAGKLYTNYSIGDEIDDNNEEHTFQTLLTFRLPPIGAQQNVQSAIFQMQPCYQRGGGFASLGTMTIYQDNYGKIDQSNDRTHPLPGARVLSNQSSCEPLDLTSMVQEAYANGTSDIQLRLIFRNHADNGVEDEVLITPNLRITFAG